MVFGIVKQSSGHIWVTSSPGSGATFSVYLPRVDAPVQESRQETDALQSSASNETILIVEDDPEVRELTREVLASCGYSVLASASPREALELQQRQFGPLHLLITDLVMPGMTGRALAARFRELLPGLRTIYMSGYTDPELAQSCLLDQNSFFLQKPFTPATLSQLIREALDTSVAKPTR
jgi:CheY-like chemotaxis protein